MSYDREAEMARVRAEHAEKLATAIRETHAEADVLERLPTVGCRPRVHTMKSRPLYGVMAWVGYDRTQYESIRKTPDPTPADLRVLVATLPPMPAFWVADGCRAHKPMLGGVRAGATVISMAPYSIDVDDCDVELQWWTALQGDGGPLLVRIAVQLPPYIARPDRRRIEVAYRHFEWRRDCRVHPTVSATRPELVKWWVSEQAQGHYTLWWKEDSPAERIIAGVLEAWEERSGRDG